MSCGIECISLVLGVGVVWGLTNPLLRRGSVQYEEKVKNDVHKSSNLFKNFIGKLIFLPFVIPFALNQFSSLFFNVLVVRYPVSVVVPLVNAIQIVSTFICGNIFGETVFDSKKMTAYQYFGVCVVCISLIGLLMIEQ